MTIIQKNEYIFSVDIEKTKNYYETHSLCDCIYCRNYYTQIKGLFPKLESLLNDFGIDISRPDEIFGVEMNNYIDYLSVDYTVCGKTKKTGAYEIDINDNLFLSISFNDGFVSPNEQTGDYFTISVMQISLPWVLDEPFPKTTTNEFISKSKNFFKKFFKV